MKPTSATGAARMGRIFASLLSADVATRVLAAVATVIVVRSLAPAAFGEIVYALATAAVVAVLVDLGLWMLLVREASEDASRAPALLSSVLRAEGLLAVVVFGAGTVLALAGVFGDTASAGAMGLGFAVMAANTLSRPFEATLTAAGRAHLVTVAHVVRGSALVGLTVAVAVAATDPEPELFLGASVASEVVGTATIAALCARQVVRPRLRGEGPPLGRLLRRALPFALLAGFGLLYTRIDTIMLGVLASDEEVGAYGVAARVLEAAVAVPAFFGSAFLATVAQTGAATGSGAAQAGRALRYILIVCVPLAFALGITAGPLVRVVAGGDYSQAGEVLARLSPVLALMAAYAVLANLQVALDRTPTLVRISVGGVALKIALNAWAIPRWGANGAALTAVVAEACVVLAQWYAARDHFDAAGLARWSARLGLAALAMVGLGVAVLSGLSWVAGLVVGLAAFAVAARLLRCITAGELRSAWASVARAT